jgi:hypothetical protein
MMGCNIPSKIHFCHSHFNFFPTDLGDDSNEHGEKVLYQIHTRGNQVERDFEHG